MKTKMLNQSQYYFHKELFNLPNEVYFPSEDSYFLAENISIKKNIKAIDLGCGSGIQSLNLLYKGASKVIAIDLNEIALETTKKNCEKAGFKNNIELIKSNLFVNFNGKSDLIVFNPPYVISDEIKYLELDGGLNGRETLDIFLKEFPKYLNEKGECFFIQTDLNGYEKTNKILIDQNIDFEIINKKKGFFEELAVYYCNKS